ncbi:MAG TPA: amidophosphoribosyltransferase [Candidatus Gracilibacteria bacterium]
MCGIFGISNVKREVACDIYEALLMLQHRGQDAAGMVTLDAAKRFHELKDKGLVKDVFNETNIHHLKGTTGIGHVRYPTAGSLCAKEAQPFFINAPFGIYLVHNGNITNTEALKTNILTNYRRHLRTTSDSEVLLNILSDSLYQVFKKHPQTKDVEAIFQGVIETMKVVKGSYSVICLIDNVGLLAFRDPFGIRPLSIGVRESASGTEWAIASEDVAFHPIEFQKVRDVKPGEAVLITPDGKMQSRQCSVGKLCPCIFEYIYLARPDSMLDGISVYKTQMRFGKFLGEQILKSGLEIDSIMPVPDSSRPAALEVSKVTGIKYREGLVKSRYTGRTFIMSEQNERARSVRRKFNTIPLEFRNRNVLLVDDSIVRGTTMKQIIQMCREAGAKKVYVASAAPPVRFPNVYGVDMPTKQEFVANGLSEDEIGELLGADKIFYQTVEDMIKAAHEGNEQIDQFEASCFDGHYITGDIDQAYLENLASSRRTTKKVDEIRPSIPVS